ncbi:MAG: hypothetical protein WCC63_01020 [Candidatus Bathyarchaeia archaeon]
MLDNKGQMRTVEAFLAILLLFSALTIATLISPASDSDDYESLATVGMQALAAVDSDGGLGRLIDEGNWTALGEAMDAILPVGTAYNLTVYDENMQSLNDVPISNGMLPSQDVAAVQYPCASPSLQADCYLLRLQLAKAG